MDAASVIVVTDPSTNRWGSAVMESTETAPTACGSSDTSYVVVCPPVTAT